MSRSDPEPHKYRRLKAELVRLKDGKPDVDRRKVGDIVWRLAPYELRQLIMELSGWDSGGWIFRNWRELPEQLQKDVYAEFIKRDWNKETLSNA